MPYLLCEVENFASLCCLEKGILHRICFTQRLLQNPGGIRFPQHKAHQIWVTLDHSSKHNPSGFVLFAFPWQTGVLKIFTRHISSLRTYSVSSPALSISHFISFRWLPYGPHDLFHLSFLICSKIDTNGVGASSAFKTALNHFLVSLLHLWFVVDRGRELYKSWVILCGYCSN